MNCVYAGRTQEGMRELEILKEKRDVNLCSTMALIMGHKYSQSVGMLFTIEKLADNLWFNAI